MSDDVTSNGVTSGADQHDADDAEGHRVMSEVGEPPVEGGRVRPTVVPDDDTDDVVGHRKMSVTGEDDDSGDADDVVGHRKMSATGEDDDTEGRRVRS